MNFKRISYIALAAILAACGASSTESSALSGGSGAVSADALVTAANVTLVTVEATGPTAIAPSTITTYSTTTGKATYQNTTLAPGAYSFTFKAYGPGDPDTVAATAFVRLNAVPATGDTVVVAGTTFAAGTQASGCNSASTCGSSATFRLAPAAPASTNVTATMANLILAINNNSATKTFVKASADSSDPQMLKLTALAPGATVNGTAVTVTGTAMVVMNQTSVSPVAWIPSAPTTSGTFSGGVSGLSGGGNVLIASTTATGTVPASGVLTLTVVLVDASNPAAGAVGPRITAVTSATPTWMGTTPDLNYSAGNFTFTMNDPAPTADVTRWGYYITANPECRMVLGTTAPATNATTATSSQLGSATAPKFLLSTPPNSSTTAQVFFNATVLETCTFTITASKYVTVASTGAYSLVGSTQATFQQATGQGAAASITYVPAPQFVGGEGAPIRVFEKDAGKCKYGGGACSLAAAPPTTCGTAIVADNSDPRVGRCDVPAQLGAACDPTLRDGGLLSPCSGHSLLAPHCLPPTSTNTVVVQDECLGNGPVCELLASGVPSCSIESGKEYELEFGYLLGSANFTAVPAARLLGCNDPGTGNSVTPTQFLVTFMDSNTTPANNGNLMGDALFDLAPVAPSTTTCGFQISVQQNIPGGVNPYKAFDFMFSLTP